MVTLIMMMTSLKPKNFLAPSKEFTIVDVILLHMIVQETNDVESRSDFDDALLDM